MLLSSKERIAKARRFRKMWGGGMRQVGLLAAAADYALVHNWDKLTQDHRRAKEVARVIFDSKHLAVDMNKLQTNILLFDTVNESAENVIAKLAGKGIQVIPFGPNTIRATFHFQITDEDVEQVKKALAEIGK
jgi:threonine aldolase